LAQRIEDITPHPASPPHSPRWMRVLDVTRAADL
jgi:hypothetical protein